MSAPDDAPDSADPERTDAEAALIDALRREDDDAIAGTLLASELVIPATQEPETGPAGQTELEIPLLERDGLRYAVAFSSTREQRACQPAWPGSFVVPAAGLFTALEPGLGFTLNPGGSFGVAFSASDVERLRLVVASAAQRESSPGAEAAPPSFVIGEPADEDAELLAAASAAARTRPEVRALRRALVSDQGGEEQTQLVIGAELDPMPTEVEPLRALLSGMLDELPERATLAPIGPQIDNPISAYMLAETEPFYVRE